MIATRLFDDSDQLTLQLAGHLSQWLSRPAPANEPFALMLAGGASPIAAYDAVAKTPFPVSHAAYFLLSDERLVPPDSEHSNFSRVAPMWSALDIPRHRLILADTEAPLQEAARGLDQGIAQFLAAGGRVPVGLLGLGPDGHTASLFSPEHIAQGRGRFAIGVQRPDGRGGVSVTPDFLSRVDSLIFLAPGEGKRDVVKTLLNDPLSIPAGQAVEGHPSVELWADRAAHP